MTHELRIQFALIVFMGAAFFTGHGSREPRAIQVEHVDAMATRLEASHSGFHQLLRIAVGVWVSMNHQGLHNANRRDSNESLVPTRVRLLLNLTSGPGP